MKYGIYSLHSLSKGAPSMLNVVFVILLWINYLGHELKWGACDQYYFRYGQSQNAWNFCPLHPYMKKYVFSCNADKQFVLVQDQDMGTSFYHAKFQVIILINKKDMM